MAGTVVSGSGALASATAKQRRRPPLGQPNNCSGLAPFRRACSDIAASRAIDSDTTRSSSASPSNRGGRPLMTARAGRLASAISSPIVIRSPRPDHMSPNSAAAAMWGQNSANPSCVSSLGSAPEPSRIGRIRIARFWRQCARGRATNQLKQSAVFVGNTIDRQDLAGL